MDNKDNTFDRFAYTVYNKRMVNKLIALSILISLFVGTLSLHTNLNVSAIELTPFVPTNTPVRTTTPTPTIFLQPWRTNTPTRTPTKTPHPDCGVLIYCITPTGTSQ